MIWAANSFGLSTGGNSLIVRSADMRRSSSGDSDDSSIPSTSAPSQGLSTVSRTRSSMVADMIMSRLGSAVPSSRWKAAN